MTGEKGMGWESPAVNCRCVHRMFLYPLSKDSHWETEKAGYKSADESVYMMRVTRPALILFRKCFLHRGNIFSWGADICFLKVGLSGLCPAFSSELWFVTEKLSCGNFLKEKLPQLFIVCDKNKGKSIINSLYKLELYMKERKSKWANLKHITRL